MVTKAARTSASWRITHMAALALFICALGTGFASAAPKVHPDLQRQFHQLRQNGSNATRVPVIVQFKTAPTDENRSWPKPTAAGRDCNSSMAVPSQ